MGFFTKLSDFFKSLFKKEPQKSDPLAEFFESEFYKPGNPDYEDIFDIANALSEGDPEVTGAVRLVLNEPVKYFHENAQRYLDRGIDLDNENTYDEFMVYDLLHLAAADELESRGYVSRVSLEKCGLSEFRQGLAKVKGYEKIKDVVEALELSESGDIVVWMEKINAELNGKAYAAFDIEMVEEYFLLAVTDRETSEKLSGETPNE